MRLSGCDSNTDLTPRLGIGLPKRKVWNGRSNQFLGVLRRESATHPRYPLPEHALTTIVLGVHHSHEIELCHFFVGIGRQRRGHNRARAGAGNHSRQQPLPEQLADHTDMQKAEHATTTEHQCRAAVTDVTAIEKIEFLLGRNDVVGQLGQ